MEYNPTYLAPPSPPSDLKATFGEDTPVGSNYGTLELSLARSQYQEVEFRKRGTRREPERCISKQGDCLLQRVNVQHRKWIFASDVFTTLLEMRWRWTLLVFAGMYFGSWLLFAILWYGILWIHGDLDHIGEQGWIPCISDIPNFTTAFLFSVETQHTTGYGFYRLGDECPEAIILLCLQSLVGVTLEGLLVGLVFVKISRAKKRSQALMFSRNAVICQRDGILCFMFRVADLRPKSHLLQASIRAQVVRKKVTLEGETIPYNQEELEVKGQDEKFGKLLFYWPTTIVHKIDAQSPLYQLSPPDLTVHNSSFEIIVVLEGIVESTGLAVQAKSSFLPSEIVWGHRFAELQSTKSWNSGERVLDYSLFHEIYPSTTTMASAADMDEGVNYGRRDSLLLGI